MVRHRAGDRAIGFLASAGCTAQLEHACLATSVLTAVGCQKASRHRADNILRSSLLHLGHRTCIASYQHTLVQLCMLYTRAILRLRICFLGAEFNSPPVFAGVHTAERHQQVATGLAEQRLPRTPGPLLLLSRSWCRNWT